MDNNLAILLLRKNGHIMHYARLVYEAYHDLLKITFIISSQIITSEEFKTFFGNSLNYRIEIFEGTEKEAFKLFFKSKRFSFIFGIHLQEYWLQCLPLLLLGKFFPHSPKCCGIICQTQFAYPENHLSHFKPLRRFLITHIAPHLFHRLFFVDEIAFALLFPQGGNNHCILLQDPLEKPSIATQVECRQRLHLLPDDYILSSIGLMYDSKRLDLLVAAFLQSKPEKNQKLLLAGRFYTEMKAILMKMLEESPYGKQVIIEDKWLSQTEFDEYLIASNYIADTYDNHFANSSLLLRACQIGRPCIISDNGWPGRYARLHHCGVLVDIHNQDNYIDGIRKLFNDEVTNQWVITNMHEEYDFIQRLRRL